MDTDPPSFLGRYRMVKVLGTGAMGVVYEAIDPLLGRTVAVKTVIKSQLVDDEAREEYGARFQREAQAAARLGHPHIVAVFDVGEQDDLAFIVMEFVRGRELAQAFAEGRRFTLGQSVRIMCELLDALAFAHAHGVVHRDIKPANVLLDAGERVKLADFGIARISSTSQAERTLPGAVLGTPSYMSPEQVLGLEVGPPTDIFAAGLILYQLLTGERAFSGHGSFGVQSSIVNDEPLRPSQRCPGLPQAFDEIVMLALTKQPDLRFSSAADFADALERALADRPGAVDWMPARITPLFAPGGDDATVIRPSQPDAPATSALTSATPVPPILQTRALPRRTRWSAQPAPAPGESRADAPVEIPALPTRLWGRDPALGELQQMLLQHRLVTVLGAGGIGKSTLALAIAHQVRQHGQVDVRWASLSAISDAALVPDAVARALRLDLDDASDSVGVIARALRSSRTMLVIDDAERVADGVAQLVASVLPRAPQVQVLVTSQVALDIDGERLFRLPELDVAPAGSTPEAARASGAVALFVDQAQALQHGFDLTADNVDTVISVCRQLDGIPLAIRMATARLPTLGLHGLHTHLGTRFELLAVHGRNVPDRQRTLRAAFDWSHGLLTPADQVLFRRLGVFVGGFTLELAQAVASDETSDPWRLIDGISRLVDRSLISSAPGTPPRFHMAHSARDYALARLKEAGELEHVRALHARSVYELLHRYDHPYWVHHDAEWLAHCAHEVDNLRAALDCTTPRDPAMALRLFGASTRACMMLRGFSHEMRRKGGALEAAMPDDLPAGDRAAFWRVCAVVTKAVAPQLCRDHVRRAIDGFRAAGDGQRLFETLYQAIVGVDLPTAERRQLLDEMQALPHEFPGRAHPAVLVSMARVAVKEGRRDDARALFERAITMHDAARFGRVRASLLVFLAELECDLGHAESAVTRTSDALALLKHGGPGERLQALAQHAVAHLQLGQPEPARPALEEFIAISRSSGWELLTRRSPLLAWFALQEGRPRTAARLLGFHAALRRPGTVGSGRGIPAQVQPQLVGLLGEEALHRLLTEGSLMEELDVAEATVARADS